MFPNRYYSRQGVPGERAGVGGSKRLDPDPLGQGEDYPAGSGACVKPTDGCTRVFGFVFFSVLFMSIMGLNAWAVSDRIDADSLRLRSHLVREVPGSLRLLNLMDDQPSFSRLLAINPTGKSYASDALKIAQEFSSTHSVGVACSDMSTGEVAFRTHNSLFPERAHDSVAMLHAAVSFDGYGAEIVYIEGKKSVRVAKRSGTRFRGGSICSLVEL